VFYLLTSAGTKSRGRLQEVAGPATVDDLWTANSVTFSTFSATPDALCGLMTDGRLFLRTGMGSHCPTGVNWSPAVLPDLGSLLRLLLLFPVWVRGCRIGPLRFRAGWCKTRLNQAFWFCIGVVRLCVCASFVS